MNASLLIKLIFGCWWWLLTRVVAANNAFCDLAALVCVTCAREGVFVTIFLRDGLSYVYMWLALATRYYFAWYISTHAASVGPRSASGGVSAPLANATLTRTGATIIVVFQRAAKGRMCAICPPAHIIADIYEYR